MEKNIEYQIFIGCNDSQSHNEIVDISDLKEMILDFFKRKHIDFSVLRAKGGYSYKDGWFVTENSLCINLIGSTDEEVFKLAKNLSMFMNQEHSLVIRSNIKTDFR